MDAEKALIEAHVSCLNCQGAFLTYPRGDHLGKPWECRRHHIAIRRGFRAAFEAGREHERLVPNEEVYGRVPLPKRLTETSR